MPFQPIGTFRRWLCLNLVLLASYLGFFHASLVIHFPGSLIMGMVIAAFTAVVCFRFRELFINRYERIFYSAIPVDIALESLIPYHSGYSFYYCAAAFWLLFIGYRVYRSWSIAPQPVQPQSN